jgi:hypothetical protein
VTGDTLQKVKTGVKAGLNISSLAFDENQMNSTSRIGFTAGIMVEIPFAKLFVSTQIIIQSARRENFFL